MAGGVTCSKCQTVLFPASELCFYSEGCSTHLIVKPERATFALVSAFKITTGNKKKNFCRVSCQKCSSDIGSQFPFGPGGAKFMALGIGNIVICGNPLKGKDRCFSNFFGDSNIVEPEVVLKGPNISVDVTHASDTSDFEWKNILLTKIPRLAQVQGYLEALQRDCIIVMPTGFGKTLVASMVMRKLSALNPNRLAVMVVDRIPLVFQQSRVLEMDTGMRVAPMCSTNRTKKSIRSLIDGEFEALVITAGSLVELLKADHLTVDFFSVVVFDECHHAQGTHPYVILLEAIAKVPLSLRPRLLGLTASPFPAKNFNSAMKNMTELRRKFGGAVIFKPVLPPSHQEVIWRIVGWSHAQLQLIEAITRMIHALAVKINERIGEERIFSRDIKEGHWIQVRSQVNKAREDSGESTLEDCKKISKLLAALDLCDIVGVSYAFDALREESIELPGSFVLSGESPRLEQLLREITQASKEAQIIVFVDTRETARVLRDILAQKFPTLNPLKVVGHGGYDGMEWDGEQEEAISSFTERLSRILVCTSVLEEGLDVPACDLVIRFCGSSSLIQFVQSRGRARKAGARLITILSEESKERVAQLEGQERIMDSVIQCAALSDCLPSQRTAKLLEANQENDERNAILDSINDCIELSTLESRTLALRIFVEGDISVEEECIQRLLLESMERFGRMKVQRIQVIGRGATRLHYASRIFEQADSVVLIGAKPLQNTYFRDCLTELSATWDFKLKGRAIWMDIPPSSSTKTAKTIPFIKVCVGYLSSKSEYDERGSFACESADFCNDEIVINIANNSVRIRIPILCLNNCSILSSERQTGYCKLFLPISSASIVEEVVIAIDGPYSRVVYDNKYVQLLSEFPVICLQASIEFWWQLCAILTCPLLGIPFFIGRVTTVHGTDSFDQYIQSIPHKAVRWSVGTIVSDWGIISSPSTIKSLVNVILRVDSNVSLAVLDQLIIVAHNSSSMWDSIAEIFDSLQRLLTEKQLSVLQPYGISLPNNYLLIDTVIVTPSRVIINPKTLLQKSRFLRYFEGRRILIVRFREEQMQYLSDKSVLHRVHDIIANGLNVLGDSFFFVCASQSQLKDHSAFFIAGTQSDAEAIQRELVPYPPRWTAKLMSGLSLFCTSDTPVCNLQKHCIQEIPDIFDRKGILLTDGAGLCNSALLSTLQEVSKSPNSIAFIIRYGGMKGVISHSLQLSNEKPLLQFRPSMLKFQSSDTTLCLVKAAKFTPLRLNREVITLLDCFRGAAGFFDWDFSSAVCGMQEREIEQLVNMLSDPVEAARRLSGYLDQTWIESVASAGINICSEPFWQRLLRVASKRAVRSLRSKTHISVERGCLLMGIPDPISALAQDEISIRFIRENSSIVEVITGPVLMYRNPCLHPGDLRVVMAVDKLELRHLVNVVVLPVDTNGYSLAMACSGGDLDGDMFALIWDERIVPPKDRVFEHLDYDKIAREASETISEEDLTCSLAVFYRRVISNDVLGRVAHLHLAICDQLVGGAAHPLAVDVAKSQSLAVDFPKTGVPPEVPKIALELISKNGYPDFMEKPRAMSYPSKNLLGDLFRRSLSLSADTIVVPENSSSIQPEVDCIFWKEAEDAYALYACAMRTLMARYGLRSEAEVVLGEAVHWHPLHSIDKGKASLALRRSWKSLKSCFQEVFSSSGDPVMKANIWYKVAYSKQRSEAFLSFAWLSGRPEALTAVPRTPEMSFVIGSSALKYYNSTLSLRRIYLHGLKAVYEKLKEELTGQADVSLYGSTALFLCDADSDIDLFIRPKKEIDGIALLCAKDQEIQWLEALIPILDPFVNRKRSVYDTVTPILKCIITVGEVESHIDISACEDGVSKAEYILALYNFRREVLPLFTLVVEWARACGVVRSVGIDCIPILCSGELHALILKLLGLQSPLSKNTDSPSYDELVNSKIDEDILGSHAFNFFKAGAKLSDDFEFVWPVKSQPKHNISAANCRSFALECQRMLYALSVCGNWIQAVEHCSLNAKSDAPMEQLLSRSLSFHLDKALDFHASHLSLSSGAKVSLQMKEARVQLLAHGSRLQLRKLREELRQLFRVGNSIGRLRWRMSAYFMEGSTFLAIRGLSSREVSLKFEPYNGGCQRCHSFQERSQVVPLREIELKPSWQTDFIADFQIKVLLQLQGLRGQPRAETLLMTVHFGNFYVANVHSAIDGRLGSMSMGELETAIATNRRNRKSIEERMNWDQDRIKEQATKKIVLRPVSAPVEFDNKKVIPVRRARSRRIYSSFYPTITLRSPVTDRRTPMDELLINIGFQPRSVGPDYAETKFKVAMVASSAFIVETRLDENLKLLSIREKPLSWVHGTLLRGSQKGHADIRIKLMTCAEVENDSDLFRFVFPNGEQQAPIYVDAKGHVRPSNSLPEGVPVCFVRQVDKRTQYLLDGVRASVTSGVQYEGRGLEYCGPFCDLSLDVVPVPLREWCSFTMNDADVSKWMLKVLSTVMKVSESLATI